MNMRTMKTITMITNVNKCTKLIVNKSVKLNLHFPTKQSHIYTYYGKIMETVYLRVFETTRDQTPTQLNSHADNGNGFC